MAHDNLIGKRREIRRTSLLLSLGIALVLTLAGGLFEGMERKTLDARFRLRGAREMGSEVVVVYVGDEGAEALGGWPIRRDYYAYLIHALGQFGAKAVGVYLFFGAEDRTFPESDRMLVRFSQEAGNVFYPFFFGSVADEETGAGPPDVMQPYSIAGQISEKTLMVGADPELPFEVLLTSARGIGYSNVYPDGDGIVRQAPLVMQCGGRLYPSFGLTLACAALSVPGEGIEVRPGEEIRLRRATGESVRVPMDRAGNMLIRWTGGVESLSSFSLVDVLRSTSQLSRGETPAIDPSVFRDKVALITSTVSGAASTCATPFSRNYPTVGVQAHVATQILEGNFLTREAKALRIVLPLLLSLAFGLTLSLRPLRWKIVLTGLFLGGILALSFGLFLLWDVWMDVVVPGLTIGAVFFAVTGFELKRAIRRLEGAEVHRLELEREKKRVEREKEVLKLKIEGMERALQAKEEKRLSIEKKLKRARPSPSPVREDVAERWAVLKARYPALETIAREQIMGKGPAILRVVEDMVLCASSEEPVLIVGETGTGKTLAAEGIHQLSRRRNRPIMTFNCARFQSGDPRILLGELFGYGRHHGLTNIPKEGQDGILKEADGGTVFLDEVGDLPPQGQNLLLGPLDGKPFFPAIGERRAIRTDVRFIFATNKKLEDLVDRGAFREDLLFRLRVFHITRPGLRERPEDMEALTAHFLSEENRRYGTGLRGFSEEAMARLREHPWPDHVRGLENAVKFASAKARLEGADRLEARHLSEAITERARGADEGAPGTPDAWIEELRRSGFNISRTAKSLSRDRDTVAQHFKGMCLKALSEEGWEIPKAARKIAGAGSPWTKRVESKMQGYLAGMAKIARAYDDPKEVRAACLRANRKVPDRYREALEAAIERYCA